MLLLKMPHHHLVLPVLKNDLFDHTFSYSVIEGTLEGNVYCDNKEQPQSALVEIENGIHHLFGSLDNDEFNQSVSEYLCKKVQNDKLVVLFTSPGYEKYLNDTSISFEKNNRTILVLDEQTFKEQPEPPLVKSIKLKEIDEASISRSPLHPPRYYDLYWGSVENFLNGSYGFYLENENNEIICEATSPSTSSNRIDLDIVTSDHHRGKGYGKLLSFQFLKRGLEGGKTLDWACDDDNEASRKLAQSLGYKVKGQHPMYMLKK